MTHFLLRPTDAMPCRLILGCLIVVMLVSPHHADDPPVAMVATGAAAPDTPLPSLMQMKLERAKGILEGLTMNDLDRVASGARSLRLLSDEVGWNVIQTREYSDQSRDFQRSTELIADAAKDGDLGRATLGYVQLTVHCVECHAYIRKRAGDLKVPKPGES